MKIFQYIIICTFIAFGISGCDAQTKKNAKTETFAVWGNCGMCKKTIEKAANKVKGIYKADWDKEKKIMTLIFDSTRTNAAAVQKAIAEAGYDTEATKGDDKAYNSLHECCQYDRKK